VALLWAARAATEKSSIAFSAPGRISKLRESSRDFQESEVSGWEENWKVFSLPRLCLFLSAQDGKRKTRMSRSLEQLDKGIRDEAGRILASGLRETLARYGRVYVGGSYALHLMAWRDLDIEVVRSKLDRALFFQLGERIASLLKPHRMQFRDEFIGRTKGLPRGLYWGIHLGDVRKGYWHIDIWAVSPRGHRARQAWRQRLCRRLDRDSRLVILKIKFELWHHPEYRRQFSGKDIYESVLNRGVRDVVAFRAYLAQKGIVI
jgi:hypothetical protein